MSKDAAVNTPEKRTSEDRRGTSQDEDDDPSTDSPELLAQVENFDALLKNQQTALNDLLQHRWPANEEDDDLADELEELARSEELLRRELVGVRGVTQTEGSGTAESLPPTPDRPDQKIHRITPQRVTASSEIELEAQMPSTPSGEPSALSTSVDGLMQSLTSGGGADTTLGPSFDDQETMMMVEDEEMSPARPMNIYELYAQQGETSPGTVDEMPNKDIGETSGGSLTSGRVAAGASWDDGENILILNDDNSHPSDLSNLNDSHEQKSVSHDEANYAVRKRSWEDTKPAWRTANAEPVETMEIDFFSSQDAELAEDPLFAPRLETTISSLEVSGRMSPASDSDSGGPRTLQDIIMGENELIDTRMAEADAEEAEEDGLAELQDFSLRNADQVVPVDSLLWSDETPLRSNRTKTIENLPHTPMLPLTSSSATTSPLATENAVPPSPSADSMSAKATESSAEERSSLNDSSQKTITTTDAVGGGDLLEKTSSDEAADNEVAGWTGILQSSGRIELGAGEIITPSEDRSSTDFSNDRTSSSRDTKPSLAGMLQSTLGLPASELGSCGSTIGSHEIFQGSSDEDSTLDRLPPQYSGILRPSEASTPPEEQAAPIPVSSSPIESMTIVTSGYDESSAASALKTGSSARASSEGGSSLSGRWSPTSSNASQTSGKMAAMALISSNSLLKNDVDYPEFDYYVNTTDDNARSPGRSHRSAISMESNPSTAGTGSFASAADADISRITATTGSRTYATAVQLQRDGNVSHDTYATALQLQRDGDISHDTYATAIQREGNTDHEIRFTYSEDKEQGDIEEATGPRDVDAPASPLRSVPEKKTGSPLGKRLSSENDRREYKQLSDNESSHSDTSALETKAGRRRGILLIFGMLVLLGIVVGIPFAVDADRDNGSTESDRNIPFGNETSAPSMVSSTAPTPSPSLRSVLQSGLLSRVPSQSPSLPAASQGPSVQLVSSREPSEEPTASAPPSTPFFIVPSAAPSTSTSASPSQAPSSFPSDQSIFNLVLSRSLDGGDSLRDETSPQYSAYTWLTGNTNLAKYSEDKIIQRYVLATLYFSTDGDRWVNNDSWLSNDDECSWHSPNRRTLCNLRGNVNELDLAYNDFEGTIPPELALLSNSLWNLDLCGGPQRKLNGIIPTELGLLTKLELLRLSDNLLSGSIPDEIASLEKLEVLDLNSNKLNGALPSGIGGLVKLKNLNLAGNSLSGSLPSSLGNLGDVSTLLLTDNSIEGPLPTSIGQLKRLRTFAAGRNRFTEIPAEIGSLDSLVFFFLENNNLIGTLPTEVGAMKNLRYLSLAKNSLGGPLPTELGRLGLLNELDLSENNFSGNIPGEIGLINSRLRILKLNSNLLSGAVPALFNKLDKINTVMLQDNDLSGVMPAEVCSVFSYIIPAVHIDCDEVECECCNFCCQEDSAVEVCTCRFTGTDMEWMCY